MLSNCPEWAKEAGRKALSLSLKDFRNELRLILSHDLSLTSPQVYPADQAPAVANTKPLHLSVATALAASPESRKRRKRSWKCHRYRERPTGGYSSVPLPSPPAPQTTKRTTPPPPTAVPEVAEMTTPPPLHHHVSLVPSPPPTTKAKQEEPHSPLNAGHIYPPLQQQGQQMKKRWYPPTTNFRAATSFIPPLSPLAPTHLHGKWGFFDSFQHFNSSLFYPVNHLWQAYPPGFINPTVYGVSG